MTCKEIYAYFESDPSAAIRLVRESAEFSEHATLCPECRRFVEEHRELTRCLHAVRDSAPEIPASLDAAVLAKYRTLMSERSRTAAVADSLTGRLGHRSSFGLVVAAAAAVVIACGAIFLFIPHERQVSQQKFTEQRPVVTPTVAASASQPISATQEPVSKTPKSRVPSAKHVSPRSVALSENSFSSGFQGLMYCDRLSCPDTMNVIRVQLPSPRFNSGSSNVSEFVSADVLVGSDGIARGIRLVE
jgi:hypothetical protein